MMKDDVCMLPYSLLPRPAHRLTAHAFLYAAGSTGDETVALQRFVVLHMFGELAERICSGRAFWSAEKRHGCLESRGDVDEVGK
jgi:hypothetical protein